MIEWLSVGKIINTHGVHGEVRVSPSTSDPNRFEYLYVAWLEIGGVKKEFHIESVRYHKHLVLVKFRGIDDMTAAEALKGLELWVDRKNARKLEEDEFFICDLIGLSVYEGETCYGTIREVIQTGSNDVYWVKDGKGFDVLIPALKAVVLYVDIAGGRMEVKLPEGLLDEI